MVHVYGNVPAFGTVTVALPFAGTFTSKEPSLAVTVWATSSLLLMVMGWPTFAASSAGLYWNELMEIAAGGGAGGGAFFAAEAAPTAVNDSPRATTRPVVSIVSFRIADCLPTSEKSRTSRFPEVVGRSVRHAERRQPRPARWRWTTAAHSRASLMAQTTRDWPRRASPQAKTPGTDVS